MSTANSESGSWAARSRRNTVRLGIWTAAWLVTMAIAVFGPLLVWDSAPLTVIAIIANLAAGAGMIVANKNHLRGLDEMQQKIQLEAMALALGVGLVVGLAYSAMDITNLISVDAEISHLVFVVSLTYLAGVFLGRRNYQ